ncbi:hypothetical protein Ancab_008945 [Ancistrocladus abbreviatus]
MIYQQGCFAGGTVLRIAKDVVENNKGARLLVLISTSQTLVLDSKNAMALHFSEEGLTFHLSKDVPTLTSNDIDNILVDAFKPFNINDWNSLFYITHLGEKLGLDKDKMKESRYVLSEYGNLTGECILLISDEMRKRSIEEGRSTTGKGCDYGVLLGFRLGITVKTIVL